MTREDALLLALHEAYDLPPISDEEREATTRALKGLVGAWATNQRTQKPPPHRRCRAALRVGSAAMQPGTPQGGGPTRIAAYRPASRTKAAPPAPMTSPDRTERPSVNGLRTGSGGRQAPRPVRPAPAPKAP